MPCHANGLCISDEERTVPPILYGKYNQTCRPPSPGPSRSKHSSRTRLAGALHPQAGYPFPSHTAHPFSLESQHRNDNGRAVCAPAYLPTCLPACLPACLSLRPHIRLSLCLSRIWGILMPDPLLYNERIRREATSMKKKGNKSNNGDATYRKRELGVVYSCKKDDENNNGVCVMRVDSICSGKRGRMTG